MSNHLIIGTRGSKLALWQANLVAGLIKDITGLEPELRIIKTTGDKILDSPLSRIGEKGLFVKEIEEALARGEIALAVHSLKDCLTVLPSGLTLGAILEREDPRDALVAGAGMTLDDLPKGAKVGTSSLRRRSQLLAYRQDLELPDLRGNLDTRLAKLESGAYDAIILAGAGIRRLGRAEVINELIPLGVVMSAVGQGAIAIEVREDDPKVASIISRLDHPPTHHAVTAERALMRELEGGCQVPIGANAVQVGEELELSAIVADLDGRRVMRMSAGGGIDDPAELGVRLARELWEAGAREILEEIRAAAI